MQESTSSATTQPTAIVSSEIQNCILISGDPGVFGFLRDRPGACVSLVRPLKTLRTMTDVHSPTQRSFNMSRIRSKDTKPEIIVRSLVHQLGGRFRLHVRNLPGKPDLVLPARRKLIFVHGCFWHCHRCRYGRVKPATNAEFWNAKRQSNVERDRRNRKLLKADGWQILVVWECWTKTPNSQLIPRLQKFLTD